MRRPSRIMGWVSVHGFACGAALGANLTRIEITVGTNVRTLVIEHELPGATLPPPELLPEAYRVQRLPENIRPYGVTNDGAVSFTWIDPTPEQFGLWWWQDGEIRPVAVLPPDVNGIGYHLPPSASGDLPFTVSVPPYDFGPRAGVLRFDGTLNIMAKAGAADNYAWSASGNFVVGVGVASLGPGSGDEFEPGPPVATSFAIYRWSAAGGASIPIYSWSSDLGSDRDAYATVNGFGQVLYAAPGRAGLVLDGTLIDSAWDRDAMLLNDKGMVASSSHGRPYFWDGSRHFLGAESGYPVALTNRDEILVNLNSGGVRLWLDSAPFEQTPDYTAFNLDDLVPGLTATAAQGMNDAGVILVAGALEGGPAGHFLLFPAETSLLLVDGNRDGTISFLLNDATSPENPYRFWINDDDDQGPAEGDDIPGRPLSKADYGNAVVDSVRDLVDFFPVFLDIKQLLAVLPHTTDGITYKLKQADGALNFIYTNKTKTQAFDYQKQILTTGFGPAFAQAAGLATTERITAAGVALNAAFLDGIKNNDGGTILVEGRVATTAPLRLVVEQEGIEVAEVVLHIKISPVEEMFRHVNLTGTPKDYDNAAPSLPETPEATRTETPANWPETQTNGKYFVFLHGYNVDGQKARGWQAEVFKRLHVLGSKAGFVGVTWHGATGLDYHRAVFHAFQTGDALAGALSFTGEADVTVAAHSLGNMVVSHAIQSGDFIPARYYIINGATPLEAYGPNDAEPGEAAHMTELAWRAYDSRLSMANWHTLFPGTDYRSTLTWKGLFQDIALTLGFAHNFYSEEENVVADADQNTSASIMATLLNQGFNVSLGAWKAQELVKGVDWTTSLASAFMERGQAGWGFNLNDWFTRTNPSSPPSQGGVPVKHRLTPDQAAEILSPDRIDELKTKPFFGRFMEPALMSADASAASAKAGDAWVRYDLFARGIPAMSNATAANFMLSLDEARNFPMHTIGKVPANGPFPTNARGDWRHSDFKDVGLPYVYPMYQAMIDRGGLNQ